MPASSWTCPWSQGEADMVCRSGLQEALSPPGLAFLMCKEGFFGGGFVKNRGWHVMLILPIICCCHCKIPISLQE